MRIRKNLKKLPFPIRQSVKYLYGLIPIRIRYGKLFWQTYNFLQESQWWSREKLEEYQMLQLKKLVSHAYENVPYYRKIFDERNLKPRDIKNFDDIKKIPHLTKDLFHQYYQQILTKNLKFNHLRVQSTTGTTGKPLQFYEYKNTYQKELAFIYHQWSRVGVRPKDKMVQLRGTIINGKNPTEYEPIRKILRFSPKIDSKEGVQYYLKKMQDFGAEFLHGYPSTISFFAQRIKKYGFIVPFRLKAILFASESIYPWQNEITDEVFSCRIFSHYGQAEKVALAGECENSARYHFVPQYSYVEVEDETNEIIGTSFLNYANPFIRYKTTDIASQPKFCDCECGRKYYPNISSIEGRLEDYIITPEGTYLPPAVITHPFKKIRTIKNMQIIQTKLDCLKLILVPWEDVSLQKFQEESKKLCKELQLLIGAEIKINVSVVDTIETSKTGKFKWVISNILNQTSIKKRK